MAKISLIALDIGGTLLSDDNTISIENLKAIEYAKKMGVKIVLATAREYSSTKYISRLINCDYGVFSNGSHLLNIEKLKTLKCSILSTNAVLQIFDYCKKNNLYIHLNQEFCEGSDEMKYFNLKHHILNKNYPDELKSNCFLEKNLQDYIKHNDITKLVIVSENNLDNHLINLDKIIKKNGLYITEIYNGCREELIDKVINYIEIGAANDTKASGLVELSKKICIPQNEILVFGDGDNDLEMLSSFENSVCMNNGKAKAKFLSKYVTKKTNNNGGVAEGIYHYIKGGDNIC